MNILVPLVTMVVGLVAYLVEQAAYYRFAGWYYRTGPAILRERWQTAAVDAQIRQAIRPLLGADELVGRESAEGFHFRQRAATINAWTRIVLRIEETERTKATLSLPPSVPRSFMPPGQYREPLFVNVALPTAAESVSTYSDAWRRPPRDDLPSGG